jgi:hypothetical protein
VVDQPIAGLREVIDRRNLERRVVHPDLLAAGRAGRVGADGEQRDVVVVVAAAGAQEDAAIGRRGGRLEV